MALPAPTYNYNDTVTIIFDGNLVRQYVGAVISAVNWLCGWVLSSENSTTLEGLKRKKFSNERAPVIPWVCFASVAQSRIETMLNLS